MDSKKNQTTAEIMLQQTENVPQWITSPEGQNAIAANLQRAHALAAQFREAERIDPEILHQPFSF